MQSRVLQRFALTAALVLAAGVALVGTAAARPSRPAPRVSSSPLFNLFQGVRGLRLATNRWDCNGITNFGNQCTDLSGSGTVEGGFWPIGTVDNYIFNGGLQIAGTVDYGAGTGPWIGDTVGVYFMDPRGDQREGDAVTNIFSSLNQGDLAEWPSAASIKDTSLYNAALVGRQTISQQDTYVRYWDGNPALSSGRKHAMGVLVEQKGLLWNFPAGNQDILYFLFRFINITATDPAAYAGLSNAGYSAGDIGDIVTIAQNFHNAVLAAYGVTLPAEGYTFHNTYVSYFQDGDEGNASYNFQTAVLPFALVSIMDYNYHDLTMTFPPAEFSEPFYPAPGFEAVKYLKSPIDSNPGDAQFGKQFGITVWGNTCNGCGVFNDAVGVSQMYRYISGHPNSALGDGTCNSDPIHLHTCQAIQSYADSRMFEASGPFNLGPGQSSVVVVAIIGAAPVHKWAATTNGLYSMAAGNLESYIGGANGGGTYAYVPGFPASPDSLAVHGTNNGTEVCAALCNKYADAAGIRDPVERPMGWGQFTANTAGNYVQQDDVTTYPGSLLDKAKVAQAIFDNKFLLPFAPDAPNFYLVPGDGQVTIAWQPSGSEVAGNPYYAVASDVTSSLYDPDFRKIDVDGYRIWRGRSASQLQLVAQFDYAGKTFTDYTGQVFDPNNPNCAPELGLSGANCAVNFQYPYAGAPDSVVYPISGNLIQIVSGGRTQLASGSVYILSADTAITGGASGNPALTNTGVPFTYVDNNAIIDGFTYFYSVSAFSVNSLKSGPSSLQSALITKAVTPRANATNANQPVIVTGIFGDDNVALDPNAPQPKIDANTGAISGIVPVANAASFQFLADVAAALPPGDITASIDSLTPGSVGGFGGPYATMYISLISGTDTARRTVSFAPGNGYNAVDPTTASNWVAFSASAPLVKYDSARAAALGLSALVQAGSTMPVQASGFIAPMGAVTNGNYTMSSQRYPFGGETGAEVHSAYLNQPVWYNEGSSEPPQPTVTPFASPANSDGMLTGVTMIYQPLTYHLPNTGTPPGINLVARYVQYGTSLGHPGDFVVTWNADSTISVRDSTDHVNVPFATDMRVSWGFVNERALVAAGVANGDIADGTGSPTVGVVGYWHRYAIVPVCSVTFGTTCAPLQNKAEYEPINYDNTGVANGNGIMLYIDGSYFIMQMASLPAAGTKWHLKVLDGIVDATCSTYTPATPAAAPTACSNYSYTPLTYRQAYVPGLSLKMRVTQAFTISKAAGNLSNVHTVPDPYYVTNSLETSASAKVLRFVNLPNQALIRIYSLSGILVRVLTHNDATGGGEANWDLRNRDNQYVASGVYFYYVEAPDGSHKIGRFTVVNYAQ